MKWCEKILVVAVILWGEIAFLGCTILIVRAQPWIVLKFLWSGMCIGNLAGRLRYQYDWREQEIPDGS